MFIRTNSLNSCPLKVVRCYISSNKVIAIVKKQESGGVDTCWDNWQKDHFTCRRLLRQLMQSHKHISSVYISKVPNRTLLDVTIDILATIYKRLQKRWKPTTYNHFMYSTNKPSSTRLHLVKTSPVQATLVKLNCKKSKPFQGNILVCFIEAPHFEWMNTLLINSRSSETYH